MKAYLSALANKELIEYIQSKGCKIEFVGKEYTENTYAPVAVPIACHPDVYYCQIDDKVYIGDRSLLKDKYPGDVLYNAAVLDKYIICSKHTSKELILVSKRIPIIVPQGYVKCNLVLVDGNHVITEDEGIAKALFNTEINCLLVSKCNALLPGYKQGFLGGCSGKLGDEIIFNGDLSKSPDYNTIKAFIENCNLKIKYFDSYPLTDIGSILFSALNDII